MAKENCVQIKDKLIDLSRVKAIKYLDCEIYKEYEVIVIYEDGTKLIECEDVSDTHKTFKQLKTAVSDFANQTKNLILIGNGTVNYGHKLISVEDIEKLYIQTAKDYQHNRLGYAVNILFNNRSKEEIFFETHLEAERLYHSIDAKIESFESDKIFNR